MNDSIPASSAMSVAEREFFLYRILANEITSYVYDRDWKKIHFILTSPTIQDRYNAQQVYMDTIEEARRNGAVCEDDILDYLIHNNFWTLEEEQQAETLKKDIENLKVKLFELYFSVEKRKVIRKTLKIAQDEQIRLYNKRHRYDYLTDSGISLLAKNYFLVGKCLLRTDKTPFFVNNDFYEHPDEFLESVLAFKHKNNLTDSQIRQLARNDPWRTMWVIGKKDSLFGKPSMNLSDEQRALCAYSIMYENIQESTDCPTSDVIDDDDAIDGWMILQQRRYDKNRNEKRVEDMLGNEKIANSDEIYVMATSQEEIDTIKDLNGVDGKIVKNTRFRQLEKQKEVPVLNFADQQQRIRMAVNQAVTSGPQ